MSASFRATTFSMGLPCSGYLRYGANLRGGGDHFRSTCQELGQYGVLEFDEKGKVCGIQEKFSHPESNYGVTGFYCFEIRVTEIASPPNPSGRGETEFADMFTGYLARGELEVKSRGEEFHGWTRDSDLAARYSQARGENRKKAWGEDWASEGDCLQDELRRSATVEALGGRYAEGQPRRICAEFGGFAGYEAMTDLKEITNL